MRFLRHGVSSLSLVFALTLLSTYTFAQSFTTISVGSNPDAIAVNPVTNKIYVANFNSANVSVINGADNSVATVPADNGPDAIAVNPATNRIYVADYYANEVTVINGLNNHTTPVTVDRNPAAIAVNPVTNQIYVCNYSSNTVTVIDGASNNTTRISVGGQPVGVAVNYITNKIYVVNQYSNNVTVIDGATNKTITIGTGTTPQKIAINTVTNKIYATNYNSQNITVIDGVGNTTTFITTGNNPDGVAVNPVTNTVFVTNYGSNTVTVVDGASNMAIDTVQVPHPPVPIAVNGVTNQIYAGFQSGGNSGIAIIDGTDVNYGVQNTVVGNQPVAIAVNPVTNRIYAANYNSNNVTVISYSAPSSLYFVPITPCRLIDTRKVGGPINGGSSRNFPVPQEGGCNIPSSAAAYSLNVTAVPTRPLGYLTIWPTGEDQPVASTMNSLDGRVKADAAIVPSGYQGAVSVFVTDTTNVVLDIDGYFVPTTQTSSLAFYPLAPCRVADTRKSNGPLGGPYLSAGQPRSFPILSSACNIPQTAQAYSLNFTVVPKGNFLGYLSVWPSDQQQPLVSTLNDPAGTDVANAAIVPGAANNGNVSAYASNDTNLIIDINGYFDTPGEGGMALYPTATCRALDTRHVNGAFSGAAIPLLDAVNSACALPSTAQAYVFNATVIPVGFLGYLTLWPDGQSQPVVSTLNALDGSITNNMAIVPTTNGLIDGFANGTTNLLLDVSSYFAPPQ